MGEYEGHDTEPVDEWLPISPRLITPQDPGELPQQRAFLWALVLTSRRVPCRIDKAPDGYALSVPAKTIDRAVRELMEYELNNRNWPPSPPPPRPLVENSLATLSMLLLLATFHNITSLGIVATDGLPIDWMDLGTARAGKILDGEWWRLITALTLHADVTHLLANVSIGGLFAFLLCRQVGSGVAWSLMLASGILGNLANALLQSRLHASVGASTAVFGAVGILASLGMMRHRHYPRRRLLLPLAAAVALLAVLGTEGKSTDLGAHLFGLLSGTLLGVGAEWLIARNGHPGRRLNLLLALLSGLIVYAAWWIALEYGR